MLPQAQAPVMTATLGLDTPVGALLTIALFALLLVGVAVESGLPELVRARLARATRSTRRVAAAGHHG